MRFAIGVPNVGDFAHPVLLRDLAMCAEEAGWDGFFIWDHLLYRDDWPVVDPWITLAAVASSTNSIRLGLLVAALARQHPGEVAKRVTSLDLLSGGRVTLGAGLGSIEEEFVGFGMSAEPRYRAERLDEALSVIDRLWTGAPCHLDGAHFSVNSPTMNPVPVQHPRPPVWIGGRWPALPPFRRASRWDGVVPTHADYAKGQTMPPDVLADIVAYVAAHREPQLPFDVAIEGVTPGADILAYERAGATWWIEALGWWRGDLEFARRRVAAGPPTADSSH